MTTFQATAPEYTDVSEVIFASFIRAISHYSGDQSRLDFNIAAISRLVLGLEDADTKRRCRTCNGVLSADMAVKPTMSLKKIVTQSKLSASTLFPRLSCSAT